MHSIIEQRLTQIRKWLVDNNLNAFIIPHEDEYLGEYVPKHNDRLHWATGFAGSAGVAVITLDQAVIFVDGRYTVQVTKQVSSDLFTYKHLVNDPYLNWLTENLTRDAKIGFDPKMHSTSWLNMSQTQLGANYRLIPSAQNPVDLFWNNRPELIQSVMRLMPLSSVGLTSQEKRELVAHAIHKKNADCCILTQLDSICWLLNIRGLDVSRLPVLLSHAIIYDDAHVDFFISPERIVDGFSQHVGADVNVLSPDLLTQSLTTMKNKKVMIDPANTNSWISLNLQNSGASVIHEQDPCSILKAVKNTHEIEGMKACHIRDGAAMVKFLCWLDSEIAKCNWHDEAQLADKLEQFRKEDPTLVDLSFDTISAANANAAMCHYNHLNQAVYGRISTGNFYLVDSGGQYLDGTTDITRTIAIGSPSDEMKKQFTLVLKGHIALASARFPKGTTGSQLDVLARQYLWAHGYDYDHGTGHGVGHFLSVHEGPQRISKVPNTIALLPGMVVSNEPGYYREDAFGIRIENLELVINIPTSGDMPMLGFESLTRCPIDMKSIDFSLLSSSEITWLNEYHAKVWEDVSPLLDGEIKDWLESATQKM